MGRRGIGRGLARAWRRKPGTVIGRPCCARLDAGRRQEEEKFQQMRHLEHARLAASGEEPRW